MTEDEFEEFDSPSGSLIAMTPKGLHALCKIMAYFKQGVDLEDIAQLMDLGGTEHIQLLMFLAEKCDVLDLVDDYAHPVWGLDAKDVANSFDTYAHFIDDDAKHRELHAAGSAFGFFTTYHGILPDDYTRVWIEGLYNEATE